MAHGLHLLIVFLALIPRLQASDQGIEGDRDGLARADGQEEISSRRTKFMVDPARLREKKVSLNVDKGLVYVTGGSFGRGVLDAFFASLSMIIISEIGDETFIIAALLAMRHPRSIVLSGALSALIVMTVLSTGLGRIVPNLISRKHTNAAATVLYTFFGLRLLYIAWKADSANTQQKELEEVEEKLEGKTQGKSAWRRFLSRFCTPIFLESFILTFLAEWGDRSQIATIALAAHKNAVGVTVGAILGHTLCTSLAVVGGRLLAVKISQQTVATVGGILFLGFAQWRSTIFGSRFKSRAKKLSVQDVAVLLWLITTIGIFGCVSVILFTRKGYIRMQAI